MVKLLAFARTLRQLMGASGAASFPQRWSIAVSDRWFVEIWVGRRLVGTGDTVRAVRAEVRTASVMHYVA